MKSGISVSGPKNQREPYANDHAVDHVYGETNRSRGLPDHLSDHGQHAHHAHHPSEDQTPATPP